jgi:hypothetical protein
MLREKALNNRVTRQGMARSGRSSGWIIAHGCRSRSERAAPPGDDLPGVPPEGRFMLRRRPEERLDRREHDSHFRGVRLSRRSRLTARSWSSCSPAVRALAPPRRIRAPGSRRNHRGRRRPMAIIRAPASAASRSDSRPAAHLAARSRSALMPALITRAHRRSWRRWRPPACPRRSS